MARLIRRPHSLFSAVTLALVLAAAWSLPMAGRGAQTGAAQSGPSPLPPYLATFQWRGIGPDRGGRSLAVSGVVGRPNEGYFGAVGGGQTPDLRYSTEETYASIDSIVRGGAYEQLGMPRFDFLTQQDTADLRAFLLSQRQALIASQ